MTSQQVQPARPPRKREARVAEVLRVERLTPHMIRVVLGGDGLATFSAGEFTDHYIKLLFPPPGAPYGQTHPRELWPVTRTYTVRRWDERARELAVDFVYHGDEGLAGPWAIDAAPGDRIAFFGPGGAYAPDPASDWHLFVGDESALPAIAAGLERVPAGVTARVFVEVEDASEEQLLQTPGDVEVTWVHRSGPDSGIALAEHVRAAEFPAGSVHAFVHGDAGFVKEVRHHLRADRGIARKALSASGYWRRGRTEEGWRAEKPDWNRDVERDEAQLAT
jgi:NADPH-dependent ferric siderophore reductase